MAVGALVGRPPNEEKACLRRSSRQGAPSGAHEQMMCIWRRSVYESVLQFYICRKGSSSLSGMIASSSACLARLSRVNVSRHQSISELRLLSLSGVHPWSGLTEILGDRKIYTGSHSRITRRYPLNTSARMDDPVSRNSTKWYGTVWNSTVWYAIISRAGGG